MKPIAYLVVAALLAIIEERAFAAESISQIEFFGYQGLDTAAIRRALPVQEGEAYSETAEQRVRDFVLAFVGKEPTDVSAICCDDQGNRLLFVGLPGTSSKSYAYNPEPTGKARLPASVMSLYERLDKAIEAAVRKGGESAQEDDSNGYALVRDPPARSLQLAVRRWALKNEAGILRALDTSSDVNHRRAAADALGYCRQSQRQLLGLVRAARDPDDEVRNNATRALSVLAVPNPEIARALPMDTFIEMLNSGKWTDRNKSAALLARLTAGRDPALLAALRTGALDSLIEMASWRRPSHAGFARILLGRIAGLPEEQLNDLVFKGPVSAILDAVVRK